MSEKDNQEPKEVKQVSRDISIEEMFTSGIGEKESTLAYKSQVRKNSLFQLKTILKNIDEENFPERVAIIKEVMQEKRGELPPPTEEELQAEQKAEEAIKEKEVNKKIQKEIKEKAKKTNDQKTRTYFNAAIITVLISIYIMLCNFADLPGKKIIMLLTK